MPHRMRNQALIKDAVSKIANLWPLQNYIAVNPLNNFEEEFTSTLKHLSRVTGSDLFPSKHMVKQALERGTVSLDILENILEKYGLESELENILSFSKGDCSSDFQLNSASLLMTKYFSSFFDNVQADWEAPDRKIGLYSWWKRTAATDMKFVDRSLVKSLSDDPAEAIIHLLQDIPFSEWQDQIELHLYNLKGWAGYILWQEESAKCEQHPADIVDFLAISLATHKAFKQKLDPLNFPENHVDGKVWLEAWEETFRTQLAQKLEQNKRLPLPDARPQAQLVFCIDVRSESIRRHIEQHGNYETYGFAGFFGIPLMAKDFLGHEKNITPALVKPIHHISIAPKTQKGEKAEDLIARLRLSHDIKHTLDNLKKDLVTSLGCVELTGIYYGIAAAIKTLLPGLSNRKSSSRHKQVQTEISYETKENLDRSLTHEQQVNYANGFLSAISLKTNFSRTVILTGHESETRNNHYASKLNCGACGANSGRISSQLMAEILNKKKVRESLLRHGIRIPEDTSFYPAVHNTTTDEIRFLTAGEHDDDLQKLTVDFKKAQRMCQEEKKDCLPVYKNNHLDWSQTQPEWGLARNGGMIIAPRELTKGIDLEGRFFLHSYDHRHDSSGDILASILAAPMRVAQMINSQYYFSTVDNAFFGAGTKITHNIVGGFAAINGNGSDLKIGLPLQSIQYSEGEIYHEPIRLQVFIYAPKKRIEKAIEKSKEVRSLCDNQWVRVVSIDPASGMHYLYNGDKKWECLYTKEGSVQNNTASMKSQARAA